MIPRSLPSIRIPYATRARGIFVLVVCFQIRCNRNVRCTRRNPLSGVVRFLGEVVDLFVRPMSGILSGHAAPRYPEVEALSGDRPDVVMVLRPAHPDRQTKEEALVRSQ